VNFPNSLEARSLSIHVNKNANKSPAVYLQSRWVCAKQMQISGSLFGESRRKKISVLIEISVWTRNDATMVRHVSRILTVRDNENGGTPLRADKMYIAMMQRKQRRAQSAARRISHSPLPARRAAKLFSARIKNIGTTRSREAKFKGKDAFPACKQADRIRRDISAARCFAAGIIFPRCKRAASALWSLATGISFQKSSGYPRCKT